MIALAIAILGVVLHDLEFGYIAFINLLLGSFIGLPLVYFGKARLKRAARLLTRSHTESALDEKRADNLLTAGLNADLPRVPLQDSVTEHTTLNLQRSDRARRESR